MEEECEFLLCARNKVEKGDTSKIGEGYTNINSGRRVQGMVQ